MLKNLRSYALSVQGEASVEIWSDPRITLGDRLSFASIHSYDKKQGLVSGISLEYDGTIKQKLSLTLVQKVNRDCRVYGGLALKDRPQHSKKITLYPNDGVY